VKKQKSIDSTFLVPRRACYSFAVVRNAAATPELARPGIRSSSRTMASNALNLANERCGSILLNDLHAEQSGRDGYGANNAIKAWRRFSDTSTRLISKNISLRVLLATASREGGETTTVTNN
jgi:hypothetical protein